MREDNYEDIINLPYYEPKKHPRMSRYSRAAQFNPFLPLTKYEEQIIEVARQTSQKIELTDEFKEILDFKLSKLNSIIQDKPYAEVTYFLRDDRKEGGKYITEKGNIKIIDFINRFVKFSNNKKIVIDEIIDIKRIE